MSTTLQSLNKHRQALILEQRLYDGILLGKGFIVTSASGTPMSVETEKKGDHFEVKEIKHASYGKWSLFTEEDAESVAASFVDGHGKPGVVIHINEYLKSALKEVNEMIDTLTKPSNETV
jgi:repressor of nif and glnA expression